MKTSALLMCLALSVMSGCAIADAFFGVKRDAKTGEVTQEKGAPSDAAGGILGMFFPWAATAIAAVGGVYAEVRRRNWKGAAVSTITGLEEFFATPEGAAIKAKVLEKLIPQQEDAGKRETIGKVLDALKAQVK